MQMFQDFHKRELDLYRLNFALVTLIPKVEDACSMKQFGPISLLNCSFKIFSKLLTIRLGKVAQGLLASNQSALIKWRYILEVRWLHMKLCIVSIRKKNRGDPQARL